VERSGGYAFGAQFAMSRLMVQFGGSHIAEFSYMADITFGTVVDNIWRSSIYNMV
jgi:hypothetical protein